MICVMCALFLYISLIQAQPQLALINTLQETSILMNSQDYRTNYKKTVANLKAHPFMQLLHGFDNENKRVAVQQLIQVRDLVNGSISAFCYEDISIFVSIVEKYSQSLIPGTTNISKEDEFAMRQLDAFGKPPAGIMELNTMFFGSYEECLRIDFPNNQTNRQYQGKFCTAYYPIQDMKGCPKDLLDYKDSPGSHINWHWCLPNSCTNDDLPAIANAWKIWNGSHPCGISCLEREVPMDAKAIIWTSVCAIFITLAVIGTFTDIYWYQPQLAEAKQNGTAFILAPASQALLAFSIYTNGLSVMDMTQRRGQIRCINCIRTFSIVWVMLGHSYEFVPFADNLLDIQELPRQILTLTATNAYFSVDSFFFLSGLLLGFLFFKEIAKKPGLIKKASTWIMFYVHRYLRLTPLYAFVIAAYATMLPYWSGGIWWRQNDQLSQQCQRGWWTNLLYVNIYVDHEDECYVIGWYLGTDMQMHIFAPIILIALWKSPIFGFIASTVLMFLSIAASFYTTVHNHVSINVFGSPHDQEETSGAWAYLYYYPTWIRFIPYLQGLLLGYLLFRNGDKQVRIPWLVNIIGWVASLSLMLTCVYGVYYTTQGNLLDIWVRATYNSLSRPAWGFGLCWIVFSCYYGYGGIIGKFLSWSIWLPFSRLTYATYIVHQTVLFTTVLLANQPIHFSGHFEWIKSKTLPLVVFSFFIAFFASTIIEIPLGKLEKLLFEPARRPTAQKQNDLSWSLKPDAVSDAHATQIEIR